MTNPAPAQDTQSLVSNAVREKGVTAVSQLTGVHRESVARAAAGLPVRRGTVALLRAGLSPNHAA